MYVNIFTYRNDQDRTCSTAHCIIYLLVNKVIKASFLLTVCVRTHSPSALKTGFCILSSCISGSPDRPFWFRFYFYSRDELNVSPHHCRSQAGQIPNHPVYASYSALSRLCCFLRGVVCLCRAEGADRNGLRAAVLHKMSSGRKAYLQPLECSSQNVYSSGNSPLFVLNLFIRFYFVVKLFVAVRNRLQLDEKAAFHVFLFHIMTELVLIGVLVSHTKVSLKCKHN